MIEIVRCNECRHRGNDTYCPMCHLEEYYDDDDGYDYNVVDYTEDYGFCHRGERYEIEECNNA